MPAPCDRAAVLGDANGGTVDVEEAIRTRRSVVRLQGDVAPETVRELVELATWAPNHRLTEPWRFTIVAGDERERLGRMWGAVAADEAHLSGADREESIRRELAKLLRAPILIVVSTRTDDDPVVAEEDYAATAAAVQNLLLAAQARGLAAAWRTGAMVRHPAVKAHLGLAAGDRIVAVIYLGYPAMTAPAAHPRDVDAVLRWVVTNPA